LFNIEDSLFLLVIWLLIDHEQQQHMIM